METLISVLFIVTGLRVVAYGYVAAAVTVCALLLVHGAFFVQRRWTRA